MAVSDAQFDALVARMDALDFVSPNTPLGRVTVNEVLVADINLHTVSRAQIDAIATEANKQSALATATANTAQSQVNLLSDRLQDMKAALNTILEGIVLTETPTGLVNGVNKTFFTAVPYIAGTLAAMIDQKVYVGPTNLVETDPDTGEFDFNITPGSSQIVEVLFYQKQGT